MTTAQELIPSPRVIREQLGYHLREVRLLRKLLRVSEAAIDERRPLASTQADRRTASA